MRSRILATAAALMAASPALAQQVSGDWRGTLAPAPGATLRLAVHIQQAAEGTGLVGVLDSLDQGASGIPLAAIDMAGDRLTFTVPSLYGRFEGKWVAASNSWDGIWSQGTSSFPLVLAMDTSAVAAPLAVPANWTMPNPAAVRASLDTLVGARPGVTATAGLVDGNRSEIVASTGANAGELYELGSITKLFTALLLADMTAKGEVKLDDPVAKYLPAGALSDHENRPITLRDLASHYSGLPRLPTLSYKDMADPYSDFGEPELLAFLKGWTPSRAPGAMFEYSNFGTGLLGYALGRAGGRPYPQLVEQRILKPLGMTATRFAISIGEAVPHGADGKPVKPWNLASLVSAGGLRSTAGDMAKFMAALIAPPPSFKPAVAMLLRDRKPGGGPNAKIGLALFARTTTAGEIAFHDGGTGGTRTSMVIDIAHRRGAIVLLNTSAEPGPGPLALNLATGYVAPAKK